LRSRRNNLTEKKPASTTEEEKKPRKTPSFLVELPLRVSSADARRLSAHFEAGRQFYNNLLGQAVRRLQQMRRDPGWALARALPRQNKQARARAFGELRWHDLRLEAIIDWDDEVIAYALGHRIKYVRLLRRPASSPRAKGSDALSSRYFVQLVLQGVIRMLITPNQICNQSQF
jgi:hypothetical protein